MLTSKSVSKSPTHDAKLRCGLLLKQHRSLLINTSKGRTCRIRFNAAQRSFRAALPHQLAAKIFQKHLKMLRFSGIRVKCFFKNFADFLLMGWISRLLKPQLGLTCKFPIHSKLQVFLMFCFFLTFLLFTAISQTGPPKKFPVKVGRTLKSVGKHYFQETLVERQAWTNGVEATCRWWIYCRCCLQLPTPVAWCFRHKIPAVAGLR